MAGADERIQDNIRRRMAVEESRILNARIAEFGDGTAIVVDVDNELSFAWDFATGKWHDFNDRERGAPGGQAISRLTEAAAGVFTRLVEAGTEDNLVSTARAWRESGGRVAATRLLEAVLERGIENPVHAARVSSLFRGLEDVESALRSTEPFVGADCPYVLATRAAALLDRYENAPRMRLRDEAKRNIDRLYAISGGKSTAAKMLYRRLDAISR